ncbi:hypothetical protein FB45DRAFT_1034292 [Roridomyces roridus]|uniref:Uncharacterized protein n=1 Tax=Roridomyces roridus TaxID=1738132 RepID=A0AAD7BDJ8_9AGAR|nr:hypothetical protein FB45DRAFT_1034292 [Roridomyces roridus]
MANSAETRFPLYCGSTSASNNTAGYYQDVHRPVSAQILPQSPMPQRRPQESKLCRSTGCGAPVHAAARQIRLSTGLRWSASPEEVTKTVVPLDRMYFGSETAKVLKLGEGPCGCRSSGVGCCVCGNALGARLVRCPTHATNSHVEIYTFLHDAVTAGAVVFRTNESETPLVLSESFIPSTLRIPSLLPSTSSSSDNIATPQPSSVPRPPRPRRSQTLRTTESAERYFHGGVVSTEDTPGLPFDGLDSPANPPLNRPAPTPAVDAARLSREIREVSDAVRVEHDRLESWIAAARTGTAATDDVFARLLSGIERLRDIVSVGPGQLPAVNDTGENNQNEDLPSGLPPLVIPTDGPIRSTPRPSSRSMIESPEQRAAMSRMQQAIARLSGLTAEFGARMGAPREGTQTRHVAVADTLAMRDDVVPEPLGEERRAEGGGRRRVDFDR